MQVSTDKCKTYITVADSFESTIRQLDSVIDISSQKLQQVAAVISEPSQTEKLQQSLAKSLMAYIIWT